MAWTVTKTPSVFGNKRVVGIKITTDSATSIVETGLSVIEWMNTGFSSMNSSNIKIAVNSSTSGTQAFGVLGITGCTSGDAFFVNVYGR